LKKICWGVIVGIVLILTACQGKSTEGKTLIIAEQYGLAYAPLQVMQAKNFIEEIDPELTIEWAKAGNTTAIREMMLAGKVDVGFMGIPPFLIARDKGMDWGIFTGLSQAPVGLVSSNSEIQSLEDIQGADRIALPQPGSIQHILLAIAAEREFGDAARFDQQLVTMKHPDGMSAMLAGQELQLHFTSPPFIFMELEEPSTHLVLSGQEAMGGPFTFIIGAAPKRVRDEKTESLAVLKEALQKAMVFMQEEPEETASILAESYQLEPQVLKAYLENPELNYTDEIEGLETFIDFMDRNGYLENEITSDEVIWN
jgi:NitT/TauT family transport system substrate-binding protein